MHELSIVMSLMELCEQHAKENDVQSVTKVSVKIGKQSGVEPELLRSSFDTFKQGTICDKAEFDLHLQEVVVKCRDCEAESVVENFNYICAECNSTNVEAIAGQEMHLMSLEME